MRWSEIVGFRNVTEVKKIRPGQLGINQTSIVAEISGSENNAEVVVLGAHLDSINVAHPLSSNRNAPGADDNASGVSVLTEVLRIIETKNYRPKKSIRIIAFAAEEIGFLGSRQIARNAVQKKEKILAIVNFDMVGYKGKGKDRYISTDYSNQDLAQFLRILLYRYHPSLTHDFQQCGRPCSDHVSWYANGFPAAMVSEAKASQANITFNPNVHSFGDIHANGKVMSNYAKLAVTFLAEAAKGEIEE